MSLLRRAIDEARSEVFNPIHPKDPGLARLFGYGTTSAAGVRVDNETAQTVSAVWAAVRLLSRSIAQLPLVVYRRLPGGGKEPATDHPLYQVLHGQPNDLQTSFEWRETKQGHLLLRGNGYSQIITDKDGAVTELVPMHPDSVRPERVRGGIVYRVYQRGGGSVVLNARDVLHLRGPSSDGVTGLDPIEYARRSLGMAIAAEEYGAALFRNSAMPVGILHTDEQLSETAHARLKADLEQNHGSLLNANKTAILEEGLSWQAIGFTPENTQFLQSRKFSVTQVAQWFQVPESKIGSTENTHYNNAEHFGLDFVIYSLGPWIAAWEQRMEAALLQPAERQDYTIRFVVQGLLRGDHAARSAFYRELWGIGALSQNEIRALEDQNPIEGGDERFVPLNMIPARLAEDFYAGGRAGASVDDGGDTDTDPDPGNERTLSDDAAGGEADVGEAVEPDVVLNGAQVQSLIQVVQSVHAGTLPYDSALEIIQSAFGMSRKKAEAVLGPRKLAGTLSPEESLVRTRRALGMGLRNEQRASAVRARAEMARRFQPVFAGAMETVTEREARDTTALVEAAMGQRDSATALLEVGAYYSDGSEFRRWAARTMRPAFQAMASAIDELAAAEVGGAALTPEQLAAWSEELATSFGNRHAASSRGTLEKLLRENPDELVASLRAKLDEWKKTRPERIAARESVKASRATARQAWSRAGHRRLQWVTRGDSCPYCDGLSGRIVGIDEAFVGKGDVLIAQGRPPLPIRQKIGHPPVHVGCDCEILPA